MKTLLHYFTGLRNNHLAVLLLVGPNLFAQHATKLFDKTIGGTASDDPTSIVKTADGGYLVGGTSSSGMGGDKTTAARGGRDYWVVPLVSGSFDGFVYGADCSTFRGWAWDRKKPNTPLTVEFYRDRSGTVLGSTIANIYRQDRKDAGKGNASHAYNFSPPGSVTSGALIRARVLGSTYELKRGVKAYQCAPARLSAETGSQLQVMVLGNPVFDQVEVEIRGAERQPLRLQMTDASGRLVAPA
ncbi:hypothetical protein [Larkinella rosea]|uniref:Uncharacterized protein n=1 Tax=Larkinella rosea TaxID=2025312 RepID=A0A3P1C452_9BACT|nr:hypothetical protein [Larkinella rosea]RRB07836.1 hypothetical protein EHT25_08690 [Larkinella rosea]